MHLRVRPVAVSGHPADGLAGGLYFGAAMVLGLAMFGTAVAFALERPRSARWLLVASLVYLPVLLTMLAVDRAGH